MKTPTRDFVLEIRQFIKSCGSRLQSFRNAYFNPLTVIGWRLWLAIVLSRAFKSCSIGLRSLPCMCSTFSSFKIISGPTALQICLIDVGSSPINSILQAFFSIRIFPNIRAFITRFAWLRKNVTHTHTKNVACFGFYSRSQEMIKRYVCNFDVVKIKHTKWC